MSNLPNTSPETNQPDELERISSERSDEFWGTRGGIGEVLSVAWPLMASTGLFSLVLFCDRLFLYWYSDAAASAAMTSGSIFWAMICVPLGTFSYVSTFVAQYRGTGHAMRGLPIVRQGIWLTLLVIPIFLVLAWQIGNLYRFFDHPESLLTTETRYFRWMLPAAIAVVVGSPLSGFLAGLGKMRLILLCDAVGTVINIALDYFFIVGPEGFPRLGVMGAAMASSISLTVTLGLLFYFSAREARAEGLSLLGKFDWSAARRLLYFGLPAGVQLSVESLSFAIIILLVGGLGEREAAATTLAFGVNIIAFVPMNGLGMALGVLVGKYLTSQRLDLAIRCVRSAIAIGIAYSFCFALAYGVFTDRVLDLYALVSPEDRFTEIRPVLRPLLQFIAAYCILDAIQIVFVGAIKGAGDTRFVLLGSAIAGFSVVGIGYAISLVVTPSLYYWWGVITVWVLAMALVFSTRYFQGKWQHMRVIEADVPPTNDPPIDSQIAST